MTSDLIGDAIEERGQHATFERGAVIADEINRHIGWAFRLRRQRVQRNVHGNDRFAGARTVDQSLEFQQHQARRWHGAADRCKSAEYFVAEAFRQAFSHPNMPAQKPRRIEMEADAHLGSSPGGQDPPLDINFR